MQLTEKNRIESGETDESLNDDGAEDVRDGSADVDGKGHGHEEPGLGLEEHFDDLTHLELGVNDSGVVRAEALDSLLAILGREEAGLEDRVIETPEEDGSGDDSDETEDEEDDLVRVEMGRPGTEGTRLASVGFDGCKCKLT